MPVMKFMNSRRLQTKITVTLVAIVFHCKFLMYYHAAANFTESVYVLYYLCLQKMNMNTMGRNDIDYRRGKITTLILSSKC